jgi:DNA-binding transcriptional ArsR family regulator
MTIPVGLPDEEIPARLVTPKYHNRRTRGKSAELYFAGSFRWPWLLQAGRSGACFVAVKLLQLATMRRSDRVRFNSTQTAKELGVSRKTLYRHLEMLEAAGLVRVDRRPGRWPVVQLMGSPRRTAT